MNRDKYYQDMKNPYMKDYGVYLNVKSLYSCQKDFENLCNRDELQFQIVHQVEELWMKLIVYTLLDISDFIKEKNTTRVLSLFDRVHKTQKLMSSQLSLLHTMSPKEYQEIRLQLGNGSGQESPGFKMILKAPSSIWQAFKESYLDKDKKTVEYIYHTDYKHCEAYLVAEALFTFDYLFQSFLREHMLLIYRSIGMKSSSLKGRSVEMLNGRMETRFFKELWTVRAKMTDEWGGTYGEKREAIHTKKEDSL